MGQTTKMYTKPTYARVDLHSTAHERGAPPPPPKPRSRLRVAGEGEDRPRRGAAPGSLGWRFPKPGSRLRVAGREGTGRGGARRRREAWVGAPRSRAADYESRGGRGPGGARRGAGKPRFGAVVEGKFLSWEGERSVFFPLFFGCGF